MIPRIFLRQLDTRHLLHIPIPVPFLIQAQVPVVLCMSQKQNVMGSDLVRVRESLVRLVQVDQPSERL